MTKIFQISLPRTRSSLVYETLRPYQTAKYGLKEVEGHPELFLEWGRNMEMCDRKTENCYTTELYPLQSDNGIKMHFVYPHIFGSTAKRNYHKIQLLESERQMGREYYIKGTLNIAESVSVVLDFFRDRRIVLTTRDDREAMYMSFLFAWESKIFHARKNNIELYHQKMSEGVTVPEQIVLDYIPFVRQMDIIQNYVIQNGFDYKIVTYEQLANIDVLSDILETDEWKQYIDGKTPIQIDKNYRELIHNYDEVKSLLQDHGEL